MRPYLRSSMCRPNTWHARKVPVTLVLRMSFHSSSPTSIAGVRLVLPAELIRMSTLPNASMHFCRRLSKDARSPTSEATSNERRSNC